MTTAIFAQDVFRFDVAMGDPEIVAVLHSIDELQEYRLDEVVMTDVKPCGSPSCRDIALWEIVQQDKEEVLLLYDTMKGHDIWMA